MIENDEFLDFICVAAPRSGTTWMAEALREHPQIWIPRFKELNFFNDVFLDHREFIYERGIQYYKKQFQKAPPKMLLGELTPTYYMDPDAAIRIRNHFPNVKILALLRNPVEVLYSTYLKTLEYGIADDRFEMAIKLSPDYINLGFYHQFLYPYFKLFPSSNIRIMIYENFFSNLDYECKHLYRFLGVNDSFRPSIFSKRVNPRRVVRWNSIVKIRHYIRLFVNLPSMIPIKRLITNVNFFNTLSELIIELNLKKGETPKLSFTTKAKLLDIYAPDINELENLLNINLDAWKNL